jgi:hypothetical protein
MDAEERTICDQIIAAGLPRPFALSIGRSRNAVAAEFRLAGVLETFEGCGDTVQEAASHLIQQVRDRCMSAK